MPGVQCMSRVVLHRMAISKIIDHRTYFNKTTRNSAQANLFVWNSTFFFFPPPCWCTSSWDVCSCMASGSLWEEASWRICKKQNKNKIKNKKNPPPPSPPPQTPKSQPPKPERTCCLYFKMQKLMLWMLALLSDWWNEKTLSCALLILDLIKCGSHTLLNRVLNVCQLRCDHSHWFGGLLGSASSGQGKYTFGAIW